MPAVGAISIHDEGRVMSSLVRATPVERFWRCISKVNGCWEWQGSRLYGYGRFAPTHSKGARAHRYAYELLVEPIPDGMVIDHLCLNRACVYPAHLEVVTQAENNRRKGERRTQCKYGHPFDATNTYVTERSRECRACRRKAQQRYRDRQANS